MSYELRPIEKRNLLIPVGHPNRPGTKIEKLIGFVAHYTANDNLGATDTANAKYFARAYKKEANGVFEVNGRPFGYGSTNKIVDLDSVTTAIPPGEVTWGQGDRPNPYDNGYKGQTELATKVYGNRQNYKVVSWEMCNNNDWPLVVMNTARDMAETAIEMGVDIAQIHIHRHFDITGKKCPLPLIDDVKWYFFKVNTQLQFSKMKGQALAPILIVVETMSRLAKLGYVPSKDGSIGLVEEAVIRAFQEFHELEVDGVAGPATQKRIAFLLGIPYTEGPVFKLGTKNAGKFLLMLDALWFGPNNGIYGFYEWAIIKRFQRDNKLKESGALDVQTLEKIHDMVMKLELKKEEATVTPPVQQTRPVLFKAKTKVLLNFRSSKAFVPENIIMKIPLGATVEVHLVEGKWATISYGGKTGFVDYSYLKVDVSIVHENYYRTRMFDSDVHVFEVTPDMFLDLEDGITNKLERTTAIKSDSKLSLGEEVARLNAQFFGGGKDFMGSHVDEGIIKAGPSATFIDTLYYKDGTFDIRNLGGGDVERLKDTCHWIAGSSWQLIYNGKKDIRNFDKIAHYAQDHPRSILLYYGKDHFALVAIDGRQTNSVVEPGEKNKGVNASESAMIALALPSKLNGAKVKMAANFDGGGSTTLTVKCKDGTNRIMNKPTDGVERSVGSILIAYMRKIKGGF